jgi:23S rRNA (adenine2503-C2)-methyltransferase
MMKVYAKSGDERIAVVYLADFGQDRRIEFVESVQPPLPREEKWVLLISTLFGCPAGCLMCDAGLTYRGKLTAVQMFEQIDYLVEKRFPDRRIPSRKFKIQFSRMGEPSLNNAVLEVLEELPGRFEAPGLLPSVSTIAPAGTEGFFKKLNEIKNRHYKGGSFQLQFSIHSTDESVRDTLVPVKKWGFRQISKYGTEFHSEGDRKITLNFALAKDIPVDITSLKEYFDPEIFLIKITPLNPTYSAETNLLKTIIGPREIKKWEDLGRQLESEGFQVILSIGEPEENLIGSNCGQYLQRHQKSSVRLAAGYTYDIEDIG